METELLSLTQDLLKLIAPKKRRVQGAARHAKKADKVEHLASAPQPLPQPLKVPQVREIAEKVVVHERKPVRNSELSLTDLCDWVQKRFKTPILAPLNDRRAADARKRFLDGTQEAPFVLLLPKKIAAGASLYKNIQTAIHLYLSHCTLLPPEQFSKELAVKTGLIITDPSWIEPYKEWIQRDASSDTLHGTPILYLEPLPILQTAEGKQRLWKALLSLPRL